MTNSLDYASAPSATPRLWTSIAMAAKLLLCAAVLSLVTVALVRQFRQVDWSAVSFRAGPALGAVACVLAISGMQLAARWTLLAAYGNHVPWRIQLGAAWLPQMGKYLPGGVASVAGFVYMLRRHGVPGAVALSVAVLLDALALTIGLMVSTPLLFWPPVREKLPLAWVGCVALIVIGVVALYPPVFVGILNWLLRRLKRQPIAAVPPVARYFWPVAAVFGQWVFAGLGLWLMTLAVTPVPAAWIPFFTAAAALAMSIIYITPFAPGGIGVREGIYLVTLGPMLGAGAGASVAIVVVAMRIVQTVSEVVLAGVGVWLLRVDGERQRPSESV